jgi:hypothetical protein
MFRKVAAFVMRHHSYFVLGLVVLLEPTCPLTC